MNVNIHAKRHEAFCNEVIGKEQNQYQNNSIYVYFKMG